MKTLAIKDKRVWFRPIIGFIALVLMQTMAGKVFAQTPIPFKCTGEAFTVRGTPTSTLYSINQSTLLFTFTQIGPIVQTGPFGPDGSDIPISLNNMGYRITDNLLYAIAKPTNGPGNFGIVKIDSNGDIFPVTGVSGLPGNLTFLAGDIEPDGSKMYINTIPNSLNPPTQFMYIVDLDTLAVNSIVITGGPAFVADWAVSPIDGLLYGAGVDPPPPSSLPGAPIYSLDPSSGAISLVDNVAGLPPDSGPSLAYGGSWFNAAGQLFVYKNIDIIYEIDLSGPTVISEQPGSAGISSRNDAAACASVDPEAEVQGCTPGYWKQENHLDSWIVFGPDDLVEDIFGVDLIGGLDGITLLEALGLKGGKERALIRHAVSALLNASSSVVYFYSPQEIIALVQEAYLNGSFEETKELLVLQNELGCPLI